MDTNKPETPSEAAGGASELTVGLGEFRWVDDTGPWANGKNCYLGKWRIGKVAWTSRSKGDTEHEGAFMYLPGLKDCLGYFASQEEAKARVERAARYWVANLNTPN